MEVRPGYKQTEVGVIPVEWSSACLRDHLLQNATYGVVKAGAFQRSGIPMLRGGDIKDGIISEDQPLISAEKCREYTRTILRERDVVIALVGYPGEAAVVPRRLSGANISRAVGLLRPSKTLLPEFLACFLNSPNGRKEFLRPSAGSAQIVVNLGALNQLRFPLPASIAEQQAIAEVLSDVDGLLIELGNLIAKKRNLKQALMQQLFAGQTRLPGFHGEWETAVLGSLLTMKATYGIVTAGGFKSAGVPMLRGGDIKGGRIGDDLPFVSKEKSEEYSRTILKRDDVVIALVGYPGEAAKVPANLEGANISRAVGLLRWNNRITPDYLVAYLNSPGGRKVVLAPSAGSAQLVVNLAELNKLQLQLPTLHEQTAIAEVLSDMDAELWALEQRREKTRALKQGMMQELLTGRTRLV